MKKIGILLLIMMLSINYSAVAQNDFYIVHAEVLNVRNGPGATYHVIGRLSNGAQVSLIERNSNDWWLVASGGVKGYVSSKYLQVDEFAYWETAPHETGETPACSNIRAEYDFDIDNHLKVSVGNNTDVIIKLMKVSEDGDQCIRIVYIRGSDSYYIQNIPQGLYYVRIAYGKDLRKKIVDGKCLVRFARHATYTKGTDLMNFNLIKKPNTIKGDNVYENWEIPIYEIMLDMIITSQEVSNSLNTSDISEEEFNN